MIAVIIWFMFVCSVYAVAFSLSNLFEKED